MKNFILLFSIFISCVTYQISDFNCYKISGLCSNKSNSIIKDDDELKSLQFNAESFNIIITEIMADPVPSVLLPEAEYIELYNSSDNIIDLSGWKISAGNKAVNLPSSVIMPGDYLILTGTDNARDFEKYGTVMAINKFPVLQNTGQIIILRNNRNRIIHSINYSDKWYITDYKAEGGWSLEMIDVNNPCGNKDNWSESTGYKGGTPGKINSVAAYNPDNTSPLLERAAVSDDSEIQIYFNEPLDSLSLVAEGKYKADHNLGNPVSIIPVSPDFSSVKLSFEKSLQSKVLYTLNVWGRITDCAGNIMKNNTKALFAKPELADSLDIIVNEVLFNPYDNGGDFVEIYNRSDKTIDIRYFNIASRNPYSSEFKSCYPIIKEHYLFFPGHYILLTTNCNYIMQRYNFTNTGCCFELNALPSLPDDEGVIALAGNQMNIIDELHYTDDMHFKLLNSTQGISLERISSEWPTNDPNNWHSASEDCGFATPGQRNSQYSNSETGNTELIIEPEVFSPDNDGYNDFVSILYNFNDPGYIANITIFDSKGRIVRRLVKNTLLGARGAFTWDGINESNRRAGAGIYLIYAEVFDLKGKVYKFKNTCVLAVRVN